MKNSTIAIAILLVTIVIGSLLAFFYLKRNDTPSDDDKPMDTSDRVTRDVRSASATEERERKAGAKEAFMISAREADGEEFNQDIAEIEFESMYKHFESAFKTQIETTTANSEAVTIRKLIDINNQKKADVNTSLIETLSEINERPCTFPEHWGEPPSIQTRDIVEFPEEWRQFCWGMLNRRGSSTKRNWIQGNVDKDKEAV